MKNQQFQRNTKQRTILLEELRKVETHPTARELYEAVRERLPKISLGTVYRNLDAMAQMGEILRLQVGDEARFDGNASLHYHLCCDECGRVFDLPAEQIKIEIDVPSTIDGHRITRHRLQLFGVCVDCLALNIADEQEGGAEADLDSNQ